MSTFTFQSQTAPQSGAVPQWGADLSLGASLFKPTSAGGLGAGNGNGGGTGWFYPGGVVALTTNITLDEVTYNGYEYSVDETTAAANLTIGLMPAASVPGKEITFQKITATNFTTTLDGNGSEPIDALGNLTYVLRNVGDRVTLISTGSATLGWRIKSFQRGLSGLLYSNVADSTAVTGGSSGATTGTGAAYDTNYTIPANTLKPGDIIRVTAQVKQTGVNSTDTLTNTLLVGSTTVVQTAAVAGASGNIGYVVAEFLVRTIGASGTIVASGSQGLGVPGTVTGKPWLLDSTSIDTTATQLLKLAALYSSSSGSNTSRCAMFKVERIPA